MAVENPPFCLQVASAKHTAQLVRQAISSLISPAGGLVGTSGTCLAITQKGTPDMHVLVNGGTPEEGAVWVPGTTQSGTQGLYYCWNSSNFELAIPASDTTNPRIETIVARVKDEQYAGAANEWVIEAVKGTATAGAKLEGGGKPGAGVAAVPASSIVLGYVLVPAKATSIVTADIENVASRAELASPGRSWGRIAENGTIEGGSGDFTVAKLGTGEYEVKWTAARRNANYGVQATTFGASAALLPNVVVISTTRFVVQFGTTAKVLTSTPFSFQTAGAV